MTRDIDEREIEPMTNKTTAFECPAIEPLLQRIECLIDKSTIVDLLKDMEGAPAGSPAFNLHYSLAELIDNMHMEDDLYGFAADAELSPDAIINRHEVFGDTLEVVSGVLDHMEDDGALVGQPHKVKRAIDDAVIANLALYGLFSLLAKQAEGHIEVAAMTEGKTDDQ